MQIYKKSCKYARIILFYFKIFYYFLQQYWQVTEMNTFSERLQEVIKLHYGNTNSRFADKIGVDGGTVSRWISNPSTPNIRNDIRSRIREAGIDTDWLFEGVGSMLVNDKEDVATPPLRITPFNELPEDARQAVYNMTRSTLKELLTPGRLLQFCPNLTFYDADAVKDLSKEEINAFKQKSLDIVNKLYENVSKLREEYERNQINKNDNNSEIN
jgi:hypothetical protein